MEGGEREGSEGRGEAVRVRDKRGGESGTQGFNYFPVERKASLRRQHSRICDTTFCVVHGRKADSGKCGVAGRRRHVGLT